MRLRTIITFFLSFLTFTSLCLAQWLHDNNYVQIGAFLGKIDLAGRDLYRHPNHELLGTIVSIRRFASFSKINLLPKQPGDQSEILPDDSDLSTTYCIRLTKEDFAKFKDQVSSLTAKAGELERAERAPAARPPLALGAQHPPVPDRELNESIIVGYWGYKIFDYEWVGVGSEFLARRANAKYLRVLLACVNLDKSPSTIPPFKLIDEEGKEFEQSHDAFGSDQYLGPLERLNPDVLKQGYVLFDAPQKNYWLQLSGGYLSREKARVRISAYGAAAATSGDRPQRPGMGSCKDVEGLYIVGSTGLVDPVLIHSTLPHFTERALKAKIQGTVVLEAIIRTNGKIDQLKIVSPLGYGLDEEAIRVVREWTFRPGTVHGCPVDVRTNMDITFTQK